MPDDGMIDRWLEQNNHFAVRNDCLLTRVSLQNTNLQEPRDDKSLRFAQPYMAEAGKKYAVRRLKEEYQLWEVEPTAIIGQVRWLREATRA